jgi:hypothetical protein
MATKDTLTGAGEDEDIKIVLEAPPEQKLVDEKTTSDAATDSDDNTDSDEPDTADARISNTDTDPEREAIRERRRLEKLERKERRDKAITRDKIELDFLRNRNDELERRMSLQEQRSQQSELSQVDAAIQKALKDAEMAETIIAKAVSSGNGDDVAKALRYRDEAMAKAQQLNQYKQQQQQSKPAPEQKAPQVDPTVVEHAKDFMEDHPWYDVNGRTEESAIVLAIDQSLAKEGFDPKSDDYWDELRKRVARRLPDKVKVASPKRDPKGGPNIGSSKEHAPVSTRKEIYLSPERKQALVDAGVWDDPVLRMKYAKRYAEYDRVNRA